VNIAGPPGLGKKKENSVADLISSYSSKLQLPVEVIGADLLGQQFFESTETLTIYRDGVSVRLSNSLAPDSEVILRNPETGEEAIAFVVGQTREDEDGHIYGLGYLHPPADPWHMQLSAEGATKIVPLECASCHSVCTLSLSSIELEVLEATGQLTYSCKRCKSSSRWGAPKGGERTKRAVTPRNKLKSLNGFLPLWKSGAGTGGRR
jgi:hypothetical protein